MFVFFLPVIVVVSTTTSSTRITCTSVVSQNVFPIRSGGGEMFACPTIGSNEIVINSNYNYEITGGWRRGLSWTTIPNMRTTCFIFFLNSLRTLVVVTCHKVYCYLKGHLRAQGFWVWANRMPSLNFSRWNRLPPNQSDALVLMYYFMCHFPRIVLASISRGNRWNSFDELQSYRPRRFKQLYYDESSRNLSRNFCFGNRKDVFLLLIISAV